MVYFTKALWPEFTIWHLLGAVLYYQRHYSTMHNIRDKLNKHRVSSPKSIKFVEEVRKHRLEKLEEYRFWNENDDNRAIVNVQS